MTSQSKTKHPVVTGLGMVCSLGLNCVTACAAARAGILRLTEIKTLNVVLSPGFGRETPDGMPSLSGHAVPEVGHGYTGPAKVLALGSAALNDLLQNRPLEPAELGRTGICLALSDRYLEEVAAERDPLYDEFHSRRPAAAWHDETRTLPARMLKRCGLSIPDNQQQTFHGGHAGWVKAIQAAGQLLHQGVLDRCLVGGIDSCLEPDFLVMADKLGILKTEEQPAGFLPGEAAAFCLLERLDASGSPGKRRGRAELVAASWTRDGANLFSETPPLGQGLEQAILETLRSAGSESAQVDWVVTDLNGLERRALDWGHVAVRLRNRLRDGSAPLWLPAASFGEVGAATGAVALCQIVRAWERSYAPGRRVLVVLGSDDGARGAVLLEHSAE